ncbi:hypothetical protein [Agromyces sp. ZXT2-6]|uniref:hypothetical protein n=1 Tax=Agromyces sp. ZXT2-6 TaxID=3461153 RepID=UPI00405518DB
MDTLHGERPRRHARATTRRPRTAAFAAVLAIAALALSACATPSAPPSAGTAPPTTASSTPTPEPAAGSVQPPSRYDLDCDELVSPNSIVPMFSVPVAPTDPLVTAAGAGIAVPRMTSILSVGGLACEWANGEPFNSQYGTNPAYVGVLVTVVPPQAAGWSTQATDAGIPVAGGSCDPETCSMTRTTSGAWIAVFGAGGSGRAIDPVAAEQVADAAAAAVDSASPPAAAATVDTGLPTDCEALVPTAAVETATGVTGLTATSIAGGWSEWAEAMAIAGDLGCHWFPADSDEAAASAAWVRGGRWAFDRIEAAGAIVPASAVAPVTVASGDRAIVRCDPAYSVCAVDLVIGPDWIEVRAPDEARAVALATEIAAGLSS